MNRRERIGDLPGDRDARTAVQVIIYTVVWAACMVAAYLMAACGAGMPTLGATGGQADVQHVLDGSGDDLTHIDATTWLDVCLTAERRRCERIEVGALYVEGKPSAGGIHPDTLILCVNVPYLGTYCADPRPVPDNAADK